MYELILVRIEFKNRMKSVITSFQLRHVQYIFLSFRKSFLLFSCLSAVANLMDKSESKDGDPRIKRSKKRSAVSSDGDCSSRMARTGASSNTGRLEDIPVLICCIGEDEDAEVEHFLIALGIRDSMDLPLVLHCLGVMA